jgi:UDP-glucose 4-epimerase
VILRVFNAYGPGQNQPPSHPPVIPNFLRQAVRGGTIVVHGDGSQTRDYVFVDDVVRAMVAAATAPSIDGSIINVGSGTETSVRALTRLALELAGNSAEVVYNPRSEAGVSRMCADLTLAGEKLGFAPRVTLSEGLRLTIQRDARFQKKETNS